MIKLAFLSTISFLFFGIFGLDDGVFITHNTPDSMAAGSTTEVTVEINKAQVKGFGKLVLNIPPGFTVENVDSRDASFTFLDQKAKFIWITMPADEEFVVTYRLIAPTDFNGTKTLTGVFSYIKENQRVDYTLLEKNIVLGEEDSLADNTEQEPEPETEDPLQETIDNIAADTTEDQPQNMGVDVSKLGCKREYERITDSKVKVILTVFESNLKGFGKIQDELNPKYAVSEADSDGAITTIEESFVKYVWFEVPEQKEFSVSYYIEHPDLATEEPSMMGGFTYLYSNDPVEIPVFQMNNLIDVLVQNDPDPIVEPEPDPIVEPEPDPIVEPIDDVVVVDEPDNAVVAVVEKEDPITNIPDPETGITYKVQIVAGPNTVGKAYMKKAFNFEGNFNIENHDGWVKYTTGQFGEYKYARDHREVVTSGYSFDGPFVTAYNFGERITVQEALMITNQKWYQ